MAPSLLCCIQILKHDRTGIRTTENAERVGSGLMTNEYGQVRL